METSWRSSPQAQSMLESIIENGSRLSDLFPEMNTSSCLDAKCKCIQACQFEIHLVSKLRAPARQVKAFTKQVVESGDVEHRRRGLIAKAALRVLLDWWRACHGGGKREGAFGAAAAGKNAAGAGAEGSKKGSSTDPSAIFPEWLKGRNDFQAFFPRYSEAPKPKEGGGGGAPVSELSLVRAALQKSWRSATELAAVARWCAACPCFAGLMAAVGPDERAHFAKAFEYLQLGAGEVLFRQGDPGDAFYTLLTGEAEVLVAGVGRVLTYGPLESFGERALETAAPRAATLRAVRACELLKLTARAFAEMQAALARAREARGQRRLAAAWVPRLPPGPARRLTPARLRALAAGGQLTVHSAAAEAANRDKITELDAAGRPRGLRVFREGEPVLGGRVCLVLAGAVLLERAVAVETLRRWPASATHDELRFGEARAGVRLGRLGPGEAFGEEAWADAGAVRAAHAAWRRAQQQRRARGGGGGAAAGGAEEGGREGGELDEAGAGDGEGQGLRRGYSARADAEEGAEVLWLPQELLFKLTPAAEVEALAGWLGKDGPERCVGEEELREQLLAQRRGQQELERLKRQALGPAYLSRRAAGAGATPRQQAGGRTTFHSRSLVPMAEEESEEGEGAVAAAPPTARTKKAGAEGGLTARVFADKRDRVTASEAVRVGKNFRRAASLSPRRSGPQGFFPKQKRRGGGGGGAATSSVGTTPKRGAVATFMLGYGSPVEEGEEAGAGGGGSCDEGATIRTARSRSTSFPDKEVYMVPTTLSRITARRERRPMETSVTSIEAAGSGGGRVQQISGAGCGPMKGGQRSRKETREKFEGVLDDGTQEGAAQLMDTSAGNHTLKASNPSGIETTATKYQPTSLALPTRKPRRLKALTDVDQTGRPGSPQQDELRRSYSQRSLTKTPLAENNNADRKKKVLLLPQNRNCSSKPQCRVVGGSIHVAGAALPHLRGVGSGSLEEAHTASPTMPRLPSWAVPLNDSKYRFHTQAAPRVGSDLTVESTNYQSYDKEDDEEEDFDFESSQNGREGGVGEKLSHDDHLLHSPTRPRPSWTRPVMKHADDDLTSKLDPFELASRPATAQLQGSGGSTFY